MPAIPPPTQPKCCMGWANPPKQIGHLIGINDIRLAAEKEGPTLVPEGQLFLDVSVHPLMIHQPSFALSCLLRKSVGTGSVANGPFPHF
jgi:hypothetical protein